VATLGLSEQLQMTDNLLRGKSLVPGLLRRQRIMPKIVAIVFVLVHFIAPTAKAEDYVVRIDTLGYHDAPTSEVEPPERILRSIELVCRPDQPAQCQVTIGKETLSLRATLRLLERDRLSVEIDFLRSIDSSDIILDEFGRQTTRRDEMRAVTRAGGALDTAMVLGGFDTTRKSDGDVERKSSERFKLTVRTFEPKTTAQRPVPHLGSRAASPELTRDRRRVGFMYDPHRSSNARR
jgi:hypothetical protein